MSLNLFSFFNPDLHCKTTCAHKLKVVPPCVCRLCHPRCSESRAGAPVLWRWQGGRGGGASVGQESRVHCAAMGRCWSSALVSINQKHLLKKTSNLLLLICFSFGPVHYLCGLPQASLESSSARRGGSSYLSTRPRVQPL